MKKSRAGWPAAISVVLLLGVVGLTNSAEFLPRSLLFVCGALLTVIGLVWALAAKSGRAVQVLDCVLLVAYVFTFAFLFHTETLGSLTSPTGTVEMVELILRDGPAERMVWKPGDGQPVRGEEDGRTVVTGGSAQEMVEKMDQITLRDYWWPGAVESSTFFDMTIYFADGEGTSVVSVYANDPGVSIHHWRTPAAGQAESGEWLAFGDLASLLPQEVLELFQSAER